MIQPCQRETIALAVAGRPDWDVQETENACIRADQAGWSPQRILFEVVRLMAIEDSEPRDLDAASSSPFGQSWRSPASGVSNAARTRRAKAAKAGKARRG